MTDSSSRTAPERADRQITAARDAAATAPGRCLMYAVFSDIVASPFDTEPAVAAGEADLVGPGLPYDLPGLEGLLTEWREADRNALKREYSGLFEVGSDGPPTPIREDLHRNQPAGLREDIVRFYDFFGYTLGEKFAWAPDHLSVELEFMHFLAYRESQAATADASSYQFAQLDFCERHLVNWVGDLASRVLEQQPDALYGRLLAALAGFLQRDFAWQQSTIAE